MNQLLDPLLILALALNFVALGVSRIRGVITAVALQGMLLGVLRAVLGAPEIGLRGILLVVVTVGLKGFIIPGSSPRHARGEHPARGQAGRELMSSLLLGAVGTGLAMVFSYTLPLAEEHTQLTACAGLTGRRCGPAS